MACWYGTNDATNVDKDITKELRAELRNRAKHKIIKLLLLGTGDSGKSTLAKQMKIIYQDGYSVEERRNSLPAVHQNIISTFKDILKGVNKLKLELPPEMQEHAHAVFNLQTYQQITPEIAEKCKLLLQTTSVSKVLENSSKLQLYDNFEYFIKKIDEIATPKYLPTIDDVLRINVRTTGIKEITYTFQQTNFTVIDTGGQRGERLKWIFFFKQVTTVIFVLALSEYDMPLREDPKVNRMQESLATFKYVINNESLKDVSIILFLNKIDLFKEKIKCADLRQCFPDYTGEQKYEPAMEFISQKFKSFDMNKKRIIFIHPTCATDTNQIIAVLNDVKLILIQKVLQEISNLM